MHPPTPSRAMPDPEHRTRHRTRRRTRTKPAAAPALALFSPEPAAVLADGSATTWYVSGYPARVQTWTPDAWAQLPDPPAGTLTGANGIRVLFSMDPDDTVMARIGSEWREARATALALALQN